MILNFGKKHNGQELEVVFFEDPFYIQWMLDVKDPSGKLVEAQYEAQRLVANFDTAKPDELCKRCGKRADGFYIDKYSHAIHWSLHWCSRCGPIIEDDQVPIQTFRDAVNFVNHYCYGESDDLREIIREMAIRKGIKVGREPRDPDEYWQQQCEANARLKSLSHDREFEEYWCKQCDEAEAGLGFSYER
jgi:hypothetical protein